MNERRRQWWDADETDELHQRLFATVDAFEENSLDRRRETELFFDLYDEELPYLLTTGDVPVSLNVARSIVDAVTTRIAKARPRPKALTKGGSHDLLRRAELMDDFMAGQFHETEVDYVTPEAFREACIAGTGAVKIVEDPDDLGRITVERVFREEILVDDLEAIYGKPRQMMQRRPVARELLLERFPKLREAIKDAPYADDGEIEDMKVYASMDSDMVTVVEAWHLPTRRGAKNGRHAIAVRGATLFEEEWDRDSFPFEFVHWKPKRRSFWGTGIIKDILGIQLTINEIVQQLHGSVEFAVPRLLVHSGSGVNRAHITDIIMSAIEWSGEPHMIPQLLSWQHVPPELFNYLDSLVRRAYEMARVSELLVHGEKPPGLNSGEAQRVHHGIQIEGLALPAQAYADFRVRIGKQLVSAARQIDDRLRQKRNEKGYEGPTEYAVTTIGHGELKRIPWKDVEIPEDDFKLSINPVSTLPDTPEGQYARIQDLLQIQAISPQDVPSLLEVPDTAAHRALQDAERDYVKEQMRRILDKGEPQDVEPLHDPALAASIARQHYFLAKRQGVPAARLDMVLDFITAAEAKAAEAAPPAPTPPIPGAESLPPAPPDDAAGITPPMALPPNGALQG